MINSNDTDSDPNWPLEIKAEDWASNGKYVNCLAFKDYIKYAYTAKAGKYEVKLTYRSGSDTNKLAWAEKDGNVVAGQTAVANTNVNDSLQVKTTTFELDVKKMERECFLSQHQIQGKDHRLINLRLNELVKQSQRQKK